MRNKYGFTIVELLIVIVVIAILAAISIVAYVGITGRANMSKLASTAKSAKGKIMMYQVENGAFPMTGSLASANVSNTTDIYHQYTSDGTTFCLTTSSNGASVKTTDSTEATSGTCSAHVLGGVITNLALTPRSETVSGWGDNNATLVDGVKNATIPTHPNGLTKGVLSRAVTAQPHCLSLYDIDSMGNTTTSRTVGVWLYATASGYMGSVRSTGPFVNLTPGTWTYVQSPSAFTGWSTAYIKKASGNAATTDDCYATGAMSVEGSGAPYADGFSSGWRWNGAVNASSSTGPA